MNVLNKVLRFLNEIAFDIEVKAFRANFEDLTVKFQFVINICF